MKHDLTKLSLGFKELEIHATEDQLLQFDMYISLLIEWNKKMNLTAIVQPERIIIEHFLDSLSILKESKIEDYGSIIDVGTGAGFPGIPIKIMKPNINLVLLDSLKKRTEYLKAVRKELGLGDVKIIHTRAEDLGVNPEYREKFDIVVSRAVAPLRVLCEYCMPFAKVGGLFISYKGPGAQEELELARPCIGQMGGE